MDKTLTSVRRVRFDEGKVLFCWLKLEVELKETSEWRWMKHDRSQTLISWMESKVTNIQSHVCLKVHLFCVSDTLLPVLGGNQTSEGRRDETSWIWSVKRRVCVFSRRVKVRSRFAAEMILFCESLNRESFYISESKRFCRSFDLHLSQTFWHNEREWKTTINSFISWCFFF